MIKDILTHEQKDDLVLSALESTGNQYCVKELVFMLGISKPSVENALIRQANKVFKEEFVKKDSFVIKTRSPKFGYRINTSPCKSSISEILLIFYKGTENREFIGMVYE